MKNKWSKLGFTLAELLIVVAIIGVLVAIAIPVFTKQLEKNREAADVANIRSAYAAVLTEAITDPSGKNIVRDPHDFSTEIEIYVCPVELRQKIPGWQNEECKKALLELFKDDIELKDEIDNLTNGTIRVAWVPGDKTPQDDGEGYMTLTGW